MAINDLIVASMGAQHLLSLNNKVTEEPGILSSTPTQVNGGTYTFQAIPVCEGYTHCMRTANGTDYTTKSNGGIVDKQNDINLSGTSNYNTTNKTLMMWARCQDNDTPSVIYEQGAQVNNFAFLIGLGRAITFQAADAGEPFLIAQTKLQAQTERPYLLVGRWEYQTAPGGYNKVLFYVNGVLQEEVYLTGTESFPAHSGDICIGNSDDSLKTYNESTMAFPQRRKYIAMLGMYNDKTITPAQIREVFERTTLTETTIAADTVANQQAALDALIGNSYADVNCAIRIMQATDATDYRLLLDNITFKRVDELRDIHVQFLGTGNLSIDNCNGSNAYEVSTPSEIEFTTGVVTGGGAVSITDGCRRINPATNITQENIVGNLHINPSADITINATNIQVAGLVYNSNPNFNLTIIADSTSSLTAANPGTGPGQVNITVEAKKVVTNIPVGAEVRILQGAFTLDYIDNVSTGTYTYVYNPSGKPAKIVITLAGKIIEPIDIILDNVNQTITATVKPDPSYI